MDVKCERCNTEYEFDDALVSGRGTTVKCTNCGHKFKIRRSDGDFSEDFWNVMTGDGRTLVFTSLRELQRAIQGYLVERNDRLSRGGLPQKPIGQIPELAPFFEQREAAKKQQSSGRSPKTQDGLGPAAASIAANAPPPPVRARQPTKPEFPAPPSDERGAEAEPVRPSDPNPGKSTLIGTGFGEAEAAVAAIDQAAPKTVRQPTQTFDGASTAPMPQPSAPSAQGSGRPRESVNTAPMARPIGMAPPPPAAAPPPPSPAPAAMAQSAAVSLPPPLPERARRSGAPRSSAGMPAAPPVPHAAHLHEHDRNGDARSSDRMAVTTPPMASVDAASPLPPEPRTRSLLSEIEEDRDRARGPYSSRPDGVPPRRRSVGGFVVATIVVGCLLLLGAVWAQKNLGVTLGTKTPPPAPTVNPRVAGFLTAGEKALADGNLDLAKESFDKASALAEKDPRVLLDLARLAAVRADALWLKSRLLGSDATDEHRITRDGLSDLAGGARRAADDAIAAAPDDAAAVRAKIDALRISGDRDGARALVGKIAASGSSPESAYVLAALDLAEVEPLWPTLLDRLKVAANVEAGPGRARAALVYALVRSGDPAAAKAEVERLASMTRAHPLLPLLRAFADHAKAPAKPDAGAPEVAVAADPTTKGARPAPGPGTGATPSPEGASGAALPSDPRVLVSQGERARGRGDYDRAKALFNAALEKNPSDSEALAGLAAIAYSQRDLAGARTAYKRVLSMNPNYMPAQVGLADVEWDSGDKAMATKLYKDIVDRYPEGAYPGRVKQRSEGGG